MKKIQIQILVAIAFITIFILIKYLSTNIPNEALYAIYLIGGIGLVNFLRYIYLHSGKRSFIFHLLGFIFMGLSWISLFIFKKDAIDIGIVFAIVSLIFLGLGIMGKFKGE